MGRTRVHSSVLAGSMDFLKTILLQNKTLLASRYQPLGLFVAYC